MSAGVASLAGDLAFGAEGELNVRDRIAQFLGAEVVLQGGYSVLDIHTGRHRGEIKSRRENSAYFERFGDIIIGKNKIEAFEGSPHECWCFFNVADGLYAIKYDEEVFADFLVQTDFLRGRREGVVDRPSAVVHIPWGLLTRVP
jgi:hypothetical protein